jgi:quinol monooxygenase YgiN
MVTVVAELIAKRGCEAELATALLAIVEATRLEEGCVQYDLHVATDEPGRFVFYENWASREALDRHAASAHIQAFGTTAPELLEQPARIVTYTRIA